MTFSFIVKSENKRTLWKTQNTSSLLAKIVSSPFHNVLIVDFTIIYFFPFNTTVSESIYLAIQALKKRKRTYEKT